jgi:Uri superfamily endonuclease
MTEAPWFRMPQLSEHRDVTTRHDASRRQGTHLSEDLSAKGVYILVLLLESARRLMVGRLGAVEFPACHYAYVGSALNGIEGRVARHLDKTKNLHWHIDYLVGASGVVRVFASPTTRRKECALARELAPRLEGIKAFGSSDCDCPSHLFFHPDLSVLEATVVRAFRDVGLPDLYSLNAPQRVER